MSTDRTDQPRDPKQEPEPKDRTLTFVGHSTDEFEHNLREFRQEEAHRRDRERDGRRR